MLGVVLVWSAAASDAGSGGGSALAQRHALSVGIAVLLAYVVSRMSYNAVRVSAPWVYVVSVVATAVTLTPLGSSVAGAQAWIALPGGFTVQPSEFAKAAMVVAVAAYVAERVPRGQDPGFWLCTRAAILAAVPITLVLLQNDTGTVLVMGGTALTMILVAGAPLRWILASGAILAVAVIAVVELGLLQEYQVDRLTAFTDPDADRQGAGFNTDQALIAIGGGGIVGHGLFQGPQTQGSFVPVHESDFVFTVAAEELGLVGSWLVIALLAVVLVRGLLIAARAQDRFGRLVPIGIVAWFAIQSFENIGMSLGIMPVTGVPLPFVSFGGSSMMACWIAVGLLQLIQIRTVRGHYHRTSAAASA